MFSNLPLIFFLPLIDCPFYLKFLVSIDNFFCGCVRRLLKNNQNNPWVQKRVFKYFYPEVVYTDSSVDRPVYRWRYRHFFGDPVTPQSTPQSEETDSKANDVKMTAMATKQAYVSDTHLT